MARVLVIDDDPEMLDIISKILVRGGYEVATAPDGVAAAEQLESSRTDLVVTDVIMPNREGLEIIFDMKKTRPEVPIVAISGGGRMRNLDLLHLAKRLGADRVLEKPISSSALLQAVSDLAPRS